MKKRLITFAVVAACVALAGCGPKKTIDAEAMDGVARPVLERHDQYVRDDNTLEQVEKDTFLRSSELVRQLLDEALTD